jgi:hypothetical protein
MTINSVLLDKILESQPVVPEPANPEVFQKGTSIIVLTGPRPWMIETWLRDCDTADKLDWHFSGGRAQVLSLDPATHLEYLVGTIPTLAEACERMKDAHSCYSLDWIACDVPGYAPRYRAGVDAPPDGALVVE